MNLKKCITCNKTIPKEKNRSWNEYNKKKFCSKECNGEKQSKKETTFCLNCNKKITRSPSHIRGNTYCSKKCRSEYNTFSFNCLVCGKKITRPNSDSLQYETHFCSTECNGISKRTDNYDKHGRRSPEDIAWKKAVHEKDNWKCLLCSSTNNLEAHHIKSYKDYPELRYDVNNGETYCHHCHYYIIHNGAPNFKHGLYAKKQKNNPSL